MSSRGRFSWGEFERRACGRGCRSDQKAAAVRQLAPPKSIRRQACEFAEIAHHMGLIGKAAAQSDIDGAGAGFALAKPAGPIEASDARKHFWRDAELARER